MCDTSIHDYICNKTYDRQQIKMIDNKYEQEINIGEQITFGKKK